MGSKVQPKTFSALPAQVNLAASTTKTSSKAPEKRDTISENKSRSSNVDFFASIGKACSGFWKIILNCLCCLCISFKKKKEEPVKETASSPRSSVVKKKEEKPKAENAKPQERAAAPVELPKPEQKPIESFYYKSELRLKGDLAPAIAHLKAVPEDPFAPPRNRFLVYKELADRTLHCVYNDLRDRLYSYGLEKRPQGIKLAIEKIRNTAELCIELAEATLPKDESYNGVIMCSYIYNKLQRDIEHLEKTLAKAISGLDPATIREIQLEQRKWVDADLPHRCQTWRDPTFSKRFPMTEQEKALLS